MCVCMFASVTEKKGHRERDDPNRKEEGTVTEEEGRRNEMIKLQIKERLLV